MTTDYPESDLTDKIIAAAIEVHSTIGCAQNLSTRLLWRMSLLYEAFQKKREECQSHIQRNCRRRIPSGFPCR